MAFVNIPPNLQDLFGMLNDRVSKLETGPNQAMYTAEAATGDAALALAEAEAALTEATAAFDKASTAIQTSANTIVNASNQLTAINGNGITVYAGASSSTGARVVLNSAGIAGYNSSNSNTFSIDASNGNVSITGASFTSGTIYGGSLNINGNCIINTSGFLTATGATVTGTLTASAGAIGGFSITGNYLTYGTTILYGGSPASGYCLYDASKAILCTNIQLQNGTTSNMYAMNANGVLNFTSASATIGASWSAVGRVVTGSGWTPIADATSQLGSASYRWTTVYAQTGTINTSDARLKTDIQDSVLGLDFIKSLRPVSYKWISGQESLDKDEEGNPVEIGVDNNGEPIFKTTSRPGERTHWGFLGQEVKASVDKSGVEDFAGWTLDDKNDPDSRQGLRYDQFIAPIVKAIQEIDSRLAKLEGK